MAYNEGVNDLKVNRWIGTDPEDGLPGQIKFWRDQFTRTKFPDKLAEFNEYVRREGLEEVTKKTEYRTLDTTDKGEIRVGDRVTFSHPAFPYMGDVTGTAHPTVAGELRVARFFKVENITIHKIERPVNALPTKPGIYTVAPPGSRPEGFRYFHLYSSGEWYEKGDHLDEDHRFFDYVADGTWTLRRLVVEEAE